MIKFWNIPLLMLFVAFMCSCDDNKEGAIDSSLILSKASITEGEEISANTESLLLTYSSAVEINTSADITINGNKVSAVASNRVVTIPLSLKHGEEYILIIPSNAILKSDNHNISAVALTLHFKTQASVSSKIAPLSNANATAQAKNVYNFLVENYGKKIISGVMGELAWGTKFYDYIASISGKYPALMGFDYIYLQWGKQNWIDYSNIAPVKNHWDNNGIVAITWHWCVPSVEGETDPTKMSFYAPGKGGGGSETSFDIRRALTSGTWENKIILKDIETLAGYMKLLNDANIPVLFRPLHEAAGDYTWGAWFWWGRFGTSYTAQLYKLIHDKLVKEHGLNNIIWVWAMQTSDKGALASSDKLKEAYPGDDYVDIVGTDLYYGNKGEQEGSHPAEFNLINSVTGGKKIIALQEVGNLFDPDQCMANGDTWSWFMNWYDFDLSMWNSISIWQSVMNNSNVITRSDMPNLK